MRNVRTSAKIFSGGYRNFYVCRVNLISESLRVCATYHPFLLTHLCIIVIGASVRVTPNFEPIVFSSVCFEIEIL